MFRRIFGIALVVAVDSVSAQAPRPLVESASWSVSYLWGAWWNTPRSQRDILTVEYGNRWRYGDSFFFMDLANLGTRRRSGTETGTGATTVYAEWHTRLSLSRLLGGGRLAGPVADVMIANELNAGSGGFLAHLHGVGLSWRAAGFRVLKTNLYLRNSDLPGTTWQALVSFVARPMPWPVELHGFVDLIGPEGGGPTTLFAAPQLLLDIGSLAGAGAGQILVGSEFQYVQRWGRTNQSRDFSPQLMAKWFF